ncbi:MarR family winged helix-turn-helix transcriptional regulator [Chitinophaga pinensis]|uniref:MarR family transcriptional regulator n=1 Tax=Chitinophaga pinensis (strain ATCC 43595 / DSM 2588 / LMG 13176 / NBRC 15968 / NCIMB 11800 / UQM 2034) TaxID=485918 RepID=A0A979G0N5_CHIPD|nr:hypothetical protein [Chitinophaga pinensis]ACU58602.1 hypothetical protein Cpin_1104 [Chitinophaga pinensis DSM 2588]
MEANKPIGWYLKEADKRITAFLNDEFADLSISRHHWLIMQRIAEQESIITWEFFQEIKSTVNAQQFGEIIQSMLDRGWVTVSAEDKCAFTAEGRGAYQQIGSIQQERSGRMLNGITEAEYNLMISVLNRIIVNIG